MCVIPQGLPAIGFSEGSVCATKAAAALSSQRAAKRQREEAPTQSQPQPAVVEKGKKAAAPLRFTVDTHVFDSAVEAPSVLLARMATLMSGLAEERKGLTARLALLISRAAEIEKAQRSLETAKKELGAPAPA